MLSLSHFAFNLQIPILHQVFCAFLPPVLLRKLMYHILLRLHHILCSVYKEGGIALQRYVVIGLQFRGTLVLFHFLRSVYRILQDFLRV